MKHLKFFETKSDGKKVETKWLMKEYTIDKDRTDGDNTTFNRLGLCKIYKKESGTRSNRPNIINKPPLQDSVPTVVPIEMPPQQSASTIVAQHYNEMETDNRRSHNQITDGLWIDGETSTTQELMHPGSSSTSGDDSQNKIWDSKSSSDQDSAPGIAAQQDDEMMTDHQMWVKEIEDALLIDNAPLERTDPRSLDMSEEELQNWIQDLL